MLMMGIHDKFARIGVIGLGYVGIPLAARFAEVGFDVIGLDIDQQKVDAINAGECPIGGNEPGLDLLVWDVRTSKRLWATGNYEVCQNTDIAIIAVETPVDRDHRPDYSALCSALKSLEENLRCETLIIVESTMSPGTIDHTVLPILEANGKKSGRDFYLAHCPERVMPGYLLHNLKTMDRVIGGHTTYAAILAQMLYSHIVEGDLDITDCVTAELVKVAENAYRDVQIAFANELALACESVGANVWRVRELVNKSPGRDVLLPGAGVGGHCIPKDPWLLAHGDNGKSKLIPAARGINDFMPWHIIDLVIDGLQEAGVNIDGAHIGILGYSYLADSDDTRNSPSIIVVDGLRELGAHVCIHDPYVAEYKVDLEHCILGSNAILAMVAHREYYRLELERLKELLVNPVLIDGRNIFSAEQAKAAGWIYRGIGRGDCNK